MALNDVSILFVEQESKFRTETSEFLSRQGANVTQVSSFDDALSCFRKHRFDITLIDLSSPEIGGLSLVKSLTDIDANIPSIVLSGNNVMTDVVDAYVQVQLITLLSPLTIYMLLNMRFSRRYQARLMMYQKNLSMNWPTKSFKAT